MLYAPLKNELNIDHNAAKTIIASTIIINANINDACAHDFLLGCEPSPKAQTKSIINPTSGIAWIKKVINQSPIDIGL